MLRPDLNAKSAPGFARDGKLVYTTRAMRNIRPLIVLVCALAAGEAFAVEGKWTPQQILELAPQELR